MAIVNQGVGAVAAAGSGNVTPTLPAHAADDIAIVVCAQHDNVVSTMPAGWTIVDATNNGAGCRVFWAWKRLGSGESNPTITHAAGDAIIARIATYRGVKATGDPWSVKSVTSSAGASTTCTGTAVTPTAANQMIVFAGGQQDDSAWGSYTGTNPTFTERIDNLTALALDASIFLADGVRTTADSTGNRTATGNRSAQNVGFLIALEEAASGQTIAAGQSTETDTGQAVAVNPRRRLAGQVTETDTAQIVGRVKTRAAAQAIEADASQAVTARKTRAVATAAETDAAQAATVNPIRRLAGQAAESDAGQVVTTRKTTAAVHATEADTAQAVSVSPLRRLAAQTVEGDTGQAVTTRKTRAVGQAAEVDTAQPITYGGAKIIAVATTAEADTCQAVTRQKRVTLGFATDAEAAHPLAALKRLTVQQAFEADTAQGIARLKRLAAGQAVEADTALAITIGGPVITVTHGFTQAWKPPPAHQLQPLRS